MRFIDTHKIYIYFYVYQSNVCKNFLSCIINKMVATYSSSKLLFTKKKEKMPAAKQNPIGTVHAQWTMQSKYYKM